jgi:hypothetical protein
MSRNVSFIVFACLSKRVQKYNLLFYLASVLESFFEKFFFRFSLVLLTQYV